VWEGGDSWLAMPAVWLGGGGGLPLHEPDAPVSDDDGPGGAESGVADDGSEVDADAHAARVAGGGGSERMFVSGVGGMPDGAPFTGYSPLDPAAGAAGVRGTVTPTQASERLREARQSRDAVRASRAIVPVRHDAGALKPFGSGRTTVPVR
jgi:hypothetical protein